MNFVFWNLHGFNDPAKQIEIVSRVNSLNVSLVGFRNQREGT